MERKRLRRKDFFVFLLARIEMHQIVFSAALWHLFHPSADIIYPSLREYKTGLIGV